jgi:hypothetical protein
MRAIESPRRDGRWCGGLIYMNTSGLPSEISDSNTERLATPPTFIPVAHQLNPNDSCSCTNTTNTSGFRVCESTTHLPYNRLLLLLLVTNEPLFSGGHLLWFFCSRISTRSAPLSPLLTLQLGFKKRLHNHHKPQKVLRLSKTIPPRWQ